MAQKNNIRSLVFIALFAALFIVMSAVTIKLGGSFLPFTLQTLAVAITGLFLKPRDAFLSILIVIVLTAIGLPLFSGQGGIATLTGPTAGFIFAFPFCALLVSIAVGALLRFRGSKQNKVIAFILFFIIFELFSSLCAYISGVPWLMHVTGYSLPKALVAWFYPFLIGDALKSVVATILAISLTPYIVYIRASTANSETNESSYNV